MTGQQSHSAWHRGNDGDWFPSFYEMCSYCTVQVVNSRCVSLWWLAPTFKLLPQVNYAAPVLAVLEHFGYNVDNLNGLKVHSLYNVMTMEHNMRDPFDRLGLWFEPTVGTKMIVPRCFLAISPFPENFEPI